MIKVTWLFIFILGILGIEIIIDFNRKKINNDPDQTTHPHAKPGDDTNYMLVTTNIMMEACKE